MIWCVRVSLCWMFRNVRNRMPYQRGKRNSVFCQYKKTYIVWWITASMRMCMTKKEKNRQRTQSAWHVFTNLNLCYVAMNIIPAFLIFESTYFIKKKNFKWLQLRRYPFLFSYILNYFLTYYATSEMQFTTETLI